MWYPVKERAIVERFHRSMQETIRQPMLVAELSIYREDIPNRLNGSGMLLINPPWQFQNEIDVALPWLWETLAVDQQGSYRSYWLR